MGFMKTSYHALEITYKSCPDGTEINVDKHKERHKEPNNDMDKVIDSETATTQKFG